MPRFTRYIEDFICAHCSTQVIGNGYTNHCPKCLWSKHVDVNPGDRAAECGGLMEPISLRVKGDTNIITHRCVVCGYEKVNNAAENDDQNLLIQLSARHSL